MAWDEFLLPSDFNLGIDPHFPSEFVNDPWVIFHGTNSWSGEGIEAQGFLPSCSIPDDHIDPRRSAFFMARSVLGDIREGDQC